MLIHASSCDSLMTEDIYVCSLMDVEEKKLPDSNHCHRNKIRRKSAVESFEGKETGCEKLPFLE